MRVLWISRHALTAEQMAGLGRFCGDSVKLKCWQANVEDIRDLAPAIAEAEVIAAVLPVHLLAQLVAAAGDKPVLVDLARRTLVSGTGGEASARFAHGGWYRVKRLELELIPLER